jgi:exonuclease III
LLFSLSVVGVIVSLMDQYKILVWNVRGLNSSARQSVVLKVVRDHLISIVCLQESKIQNVSSQLLVDACGPTFKHHFAVPSIGATGGLLIAWDEDVVHLDLCTSNQHFLIVCCQSKITGESWFLGNVYGPQETLRN